MTIDRKPSDLPSLVSVAALLARLGHGAEARAVLDAERKGQSMSTTNGELWAEQFPELAKIQGNTSHANLAQPTTRKRKAKVAMLLPPPERAGDVYVITLPLPSRSLNPNGRPHWRTKQKAAKAYKETAATLMLVVARGEHWNAARIDIALWGPKQQDNDNLIASLKNALDGISETIDCNDRYFTIGEIIQNVGKASGGRREVVIRVTNMGEPKGPNP